MQRSFFKSVAPVVDYDSNKFVPNYELEIKDKKDASTELKDYKILNEVNTFVKVDTEQKSTK